MGEIGDSSPELFLVEGRDVNLCVCRGCVGVVGRDECNARVCSESVFTVGHPDNRVFASSLLIGVCARDVPFAIPVGVGAKEKASSKPTDKSGQAGTRFVDIESG